MSKKINDYVFTYGDKNLEKILKDYLLFKINEGKFNEPSPKEGEHE